MSSKPKPQVKKVVLAYSGGLDTSVIVPWLKENYGCEVVCFCADVGQGDEDLAGLEQKATQERCKSIHHSRYERGICQRISLSRCSRWGQYMNTSIYWAPRLPVL